MKTQEIKDNPALECIHFKECSFNKCPLDKNYKKLTHSLFDITQSCRLSKGVRKRIAKKYGIIYIKKNKQRFKGGKSAKSSLRNKFQTV